jgi:hypothetical protein
MNFKMSYESFTPVITIFCCPHSVAMCVCCRLRRWRQRVPSKLWQASALLPGVAQFVMQLEETFSPLGLATLFPVNSNNRSKPKSEWEEKVGGVAIDTTFNGGHTFVFKFKFAATKVPRQCPLFLMVKVGLVRIRRLEVEKVRWRVKQGDKLSRILLRSYTNSNFGISLGRAA